jgi:hypothetical protein
LLQRQERLKEEQTKDAGDYLVCLDYCNGTSKKEVARVRIIIIREYDGSWCNSSLLNLLGANN